MRALALVFLLAAPSAHAQWVCQLGNTRGAGYDARLDQPPGARAAGELQRIYAALCPGGCGRYFLASNASAPNALAMAVGRGQSKIAFNPGFMNQVARQHGPGASFGILAHEFGHHIDFHTTPSWMNNAWSRELKADAWAGCALARVGGSTAQIENSLRAIAAYPSASHPGWPQRHQAVRTGFVRCGGEWRSSFDLGASRPTPPRPPPMARLCHTNFGRCSLTGALPVGAPCTCQARDMYGRIVRVDRGHAR